MEQKRGVRKTQLRVTCEMDYMWGDRIPGKPMGRGSKSQTEKKDNCSGKKRKGLMQEDVENEWSELGGSAAAREGLAKGRMNCDTVTS